MRTVVAVLLILAAAAATWTSFQAWSRRTPAGRYEDTPGLALGRLDQRKHFTYAGWRYRAITAMLYIVAGALGLIWLWMGRQ
jgi:hypothetical protein